MKFAQKVNSRLNHRISEILSVLTCHCNLFKAWKAKLEWIHSALRWYNMIDHCDKYLVVALKAVSRSGIVHFFDPQKIEPARNPDWVRMSTDYFHNGNIPKILILLETYTFLLYLYIWTFTVATTTIAIVPFIYHYWVYFSMNQFSEKALCNFALQ